MRSHLSMQTRPQPLEDPSDQIPSPNAQFGSHLESIIKKPMSPTPLFLSAKQPASKAAQQAGLIRKVFENSKRVSWNASACESKQSSIIENLKREKKRGRRRNMQFMYESLRALEKMDAPMNLHFTSSGTGHIYRGPLDAEGPDQ